HAGGNLLQYRGDPIAVLVKGDGHGHSRIAEAAAGIADRRDGAERDDMDAAVTAAQPDRAHGELFDLAGQRRDGDHIADLDRVLEQHKHAGDHVLYQLLRTETDRDPDNAGAGKQWRDVDANLAQRG